ncbi:MAG: hypothetical protein WHX52_12815 [Anaerolineae bacterium]
MFNRKMNRREFLKVVVASAAAVGLSHFRFLNFGGVGTVLADNIGCDIGIPDFCNPPQDADLCSPTSSSDVCVPEQGESDECIPMSEADICDPVNPPPDICAPPDDPDVCEVPPGGPDTCMKAPDDPDICPDGGPPVGDGDICNETAPNANPDECVPAVNESDSCSVSAEPDFCRNPETGVVMHDICNPPYDSDICVENGQNVVDICDPAAGDEDQPPNVTRITSLRAHPATAALGVVAAAGAVATLIHASDNREARSKDKQ